MPVIGALKNIDPNVGAQDFIYENGDFFLGNSANPQNWRPVSLEQIYKLDNMGALKWNSDNHRRQILEHYSKISGVKLPSNLTDGITAVSAPKENPFRGFITALFSNNVVRFSILIVLVVGIIWGALSAASFLSYSPTITSKDAATLLNKYQNVSDKNVEDITAFGLRYQFINESGIYNKELNDVIKKISANTETAIDIDAIVKSTVEKADIADSQKVLSDISAIEQKKNKYGLKGPQRIIGYILFGTKDFYSDDAINNNSNVAAVLGKVTLNLSYLDNLYIKKVDSKVITKNNTDSSFSYPVVFKSTDKFSDATVYANFTISKNRSFGPRFSGINFQTVSEAK